MDFKGVKYGCDGNGEFDGIVEEIGVIFLFLVGVVDFSNFGVMLCVECVWFNCVGLIICLEMVFDLGYWLMVEVVCVELMVWLCIYEIFNVWMCIDVMFG